MSKIQKILQFTCQECQNNYQLLEIHQGENKPCREECREQWQSLLNHHYQEQIILYLAQKEADHD